MALATYWTKALWAMGVLALAACDTDNKNAFEDFDPASGVEDTADHFAGLLKLSQDVSANAPSVDLPANGSAQYSGSVFLGSVSATGSDASVLNVLGDLTADVDFSGPASASLSNLRGEDERERDVTWALTLSTTNAGGSGALTTAATADGGRSGDLGVVLTGDVTPENATGLDLTGTASLALDGAMRGDGGSHVVGPAVLAIDDPSTTAEADATGAGSFWLVKD